MCVLGMEHDKLFAIANELLLSPVTLLVRLIMLRDTHERRVPPCVLAIPFADSRVSNAGNWQVDHCISSNLPVLTIETSISR